MKVSLKNLSALFASLLLALSLTSCGDDISPDEPTPGPDPGTTPSLVIGDKQTEIKSVGCYHNKRSQGYHLVLSSEVLDFSKGLFTIPKGSLLAIDIPEDYCGNEYDVKDIKDVVLPDGEGWVFYLVYAQDGTSTNELSVTSGDISSGKISVTFDLHKMVSCKLSVTLTDGTKLECEYEGTYQPSDEYICNWL